MQNDAAILENMENFLYSEMYTVISLLDVYPRDRKSYIYIKTCIQNLYQLYA